MADISEHLDGLKQQLNAFLRSKLGSDVSIIGQLSRLQGGFDTDTYAFTIETAPQDFPTELVLRHFQSAGESGRVVAETTIQNAAHAAGHAVPFVPIDSTGELIDNRCFLLMERLPGSALLPQLEDPALMQQFLVLMARTQAGLHKIDSGELYKQLSDSGVDVVRMAPSAMLFRITAIADAAKHDKLPAINEWLVKNMPDQPADPVVCHGDFHPNNILYADGNVTGVIDWSNVMFTHAEFDVAITCLTISIGPPEMDEGSRTAMQPLIDSLLAKYLAAYRELTPLDDDLLAYYGALRSAHAYAKITGAALGIDSPYSAGDGYSWHLPPMFNAMSRMIKSSTGIAISRE